MPLRPWISSEKRLKCSNRPWSRNVRTERPSSKNTRKPRLKSPLWTRSFRTRKSATLISIRRRWCSRRLLSAKAQLINYKAGQVWKELVHLSLSPMLWRQKRTAQPLVTRQLSSWRTKACQIVHLTHWPSHLCTGITRWQGRHIALEVEKRRRAPNRPSRLWFRRSSTTRSRRDSLRTRRRRRDAWSRSMIWRRQLRERINRLPTWKKCSSASLK